MTKKWSEKPQESNNVWLRRRSYDKRKDRLNRKLSLLLHALAVLITKTKWFIRSFVSWTLIETKRKPNPNPNLDST